MIGRITLAAACMITSGAAFAQEEKPLTNFEDTTMMLKEVTVKSPFPKTRVKGDAMRTIVTGSILEKAGKGVDVLNRIPQLKADKDGSVEVFGRGNAEVYINGTNEKTIMADGTETLHQVDNLTKSKNRFWAAKLIFSYPVWKGNLSIGGEYSHNNRTDAYSFTSEESLPVKATDTNIKEAATAAFVEYGRRFGKLYAQVGLRYEHLNTGYYEFGVKQEEMSRNYGDWFPTAVLSMPVGQAQFSLSYRKDIERPAYSQLTNSTIYINRYSFQAGNPYLRPTYTSNLALNAAYHAFNMMVSYAHTKDVVTMLTEHYPGSDDPTLNLIHPVNGEKGYDQWVISPSYRPTIGKWHPMWSVGFIVQNYKTPTATGEETTLNHPFWQFVWNNDIELPAHFRINASAQLTTKGDYNNFRMTENNLNISMGIQRDLNLKTLGMLTADLRCYDMFNTGKTGVTIYGPRELTNYNPGRRFISLDVTWKFNDARSKYRGTGAGKEQKARL